MSTRFLSRTVAAAALVFALTAAASAARINIPGVTFVPRDFGGETINGEATAGMLANADGVYYAPVIFPSGGKVCSFALVFRDVDLEEGITARLLRKKYKVGGNAFSGPAEMASLQTVGQSDSIRRKVTTSIKQPNIDLASSFYFVELTMPIVTLQTIGVEIEYKKTC